MSGAPPHLDLLDYKPELVEARRPGLPRRVPQGQAVRVHLRRARSCSARRSTFKQHGKAGIWMSDAIPHAARRRRRPDRHPVDEDRRVQPRPGGAAALHRLRPAGPAEHRARGSRYGLGSESENLPGFVVLISSGVQPSGGQGCWGSGFLPSVFQGVQCRSKGEPVLYLSDPPGMDRDMRRLGLDALKDLNELQAKELGHPETRTRIAQYELAFRMQTLGHRGDGHLEGAAEDARRLRGEARGRRASPTTACSPAGWSSRACGSCNSSTGAGTSTAPARTRTSATG